ncbi:MAG: YciI-like protein [Acidimicrobiales bacterium]
MYWLLFYDYVDDILERRAPFREAHLALAGAAHEAGTLLMAGALVDPPDGAVFVFRTDDRSVVEDFVRHDPYVDAGLVTAWRIRSWTVVVT